MKKGYWILHVDVTDADNYPKYLAADAAAFEKYDATHVLLAAEKPFTLVALNMPALSASPGAESELHAMQRMALLISRQEARA